MLKGPIKILLVEDDTGDALLVKSHLKQSNVNFNVTHVERCQEALACLEEPFDLIITDLHLPDKTGIETFDLLHKKAPDTPTIILSGLSEEDVALESVRRGAQDYLLKNIMNSELLGRIILYSIERKRLERAKDDLISNVSHELRTPLSIVKESVSQIYEEFHGSITQDQRKYLTVALNNLTRLGSVIGNLLDFARIQKGEVVLSRRKTDFLRLCEDIVANFQIKLEKKNLSFKKNYPLQVVEAFIDSEKISRVLINLIDNAIKFTEKGKLTLDVLVEDDLLRCSLSDTGKGIPKGKGEEIFKQFKQIDREAGPGEKGTGLGLAICQHIIEQHGGTIWAESEVGKGSVFTFILPIKGKEYPDEKENSDY